VCACACDVLVLVMCVFDVCVCACVLVYTLCIRTVDSALGETLLQIEVRHLLMSAPVPLAVGVSDVIMWSCCD
jgi:hypothetical protein